MRTSSLTIGIFAFAISAPAPAASQICAGSTSFTSSSFLVSTRAAISSDSHGVGVAVTLGTPWTFLGVGIGTTHFDKLNGSSFDVDVGAGYELPLDHQGNIQLCPILSVGHSAGPHHTPYGDYFETDVAAGIRVGDVVLQSTHVRLIPTVGLGLWHSQQEFRSPAPGRITFSRAAHTAGVLTVRAGVVFGSTLSLVSGAAIPIGLANRSSAFDLTLAVTLRH